MAKNPLIRKISQKSFKPSGNKSAGILDDHAVRKNIATREGTIEKVPVNDSDIANKKYVDEAVSGVSRLWEIDGTETQLIISSDIDLQTKKIINCVDPTANQEVATKKYVDDNLISIGGNDKAIQFNDSGSFQGSDDFTWTGESLILDKDNTTEFRQNVSNNSATTRGLLTMQRSRGTTATPTTIINGDSLGLIRWRGRDDTGYADVTEIESFADGVWSTGDRPTSLKFYTTTSGNASASLKMTLRQDGRLTDLNSITLNESAYTPEAFPNSAASTGWFDMSDNVLLLHLENNYNDSSGEGNNATNHGTTFSTSSKVGSYASSFDGTNDYIEVPNLGTISGASVSFWVYQGDYSDTYAYYVDFRTSSSVGTGEIYSSSGLTVGSSSGTIYVDGVTGTTITKNKWHHIVVSGIDIDSSSIEVIGSRFDLTATRLFKGKIDEFTVWDSTLTALNVKEIYEMQKVGKVGVKGEIIFSEDGTNSKHYGYDGDNWNDLY